MEFYCLHCKKQYASYKSLWNHNKKYNHPKKEAQLKSNTDATTAQLNRHYIATTPPLPHDQSNIPASLVCKYCNRVFNHRNNRLQHEKRCKVKQDIDHAKQEEEKQKEKDRAMEEKRLDIEIKKREAELLRLQMKTQKNATNTITVQKINKALQNSHNTVNNTQNNNITNNYQIVALGKENIQNFLTDADKKMIINSKRFALQRLIELVHCGKFNQFRNIFITNIKDNYMYKFDDRKHMFSMVPKEETLKMLLGYRLDDLELIYDQLLTDNKVDDKTKRCMERFINDMRDQDEKEYKYEINDIKMLLFNERDKMLPEIMDNISLVVSVHEIV